MTKKNLPKYIMPTPIDLADRRWPARTVEKSPIWCSVDLREGNRGFPNPLNPAQKQELFELLCHIGFKQIEVAFPSSSQDDFDFTRQLIEQQLIPEDVFISVLAQCYEQSIERTFEALRGIPRAIVHASCATSELHMRQVFGLSRGAVLGIAVQAVQQIRHLADERPETDFRLEFSLEEFTDTDLDFALEMCEAVFEAWGQTTAERPLILNLPASVERRPPNQYADMIEWLGKNLSQPQKVLLSAHTHNDQGMAVAASELALLAGAQRVEGTLFGHGERAGNADLVTLANNLYARGIHTGLDFSNLPEIIETVERMSGMPVHDRQPYAGEYVFSAFSEAHQDAIRKGYKKLGEAEEVFEVGWKVPYLHIDPTDLGRRYESLIRANTQSGKGGVVWVLEREYNLEPPKQMYPEISAAAQLFSYRVGREVTSSEIYQVFQETFIRPIGPYQLVGYWPRPDETDPTIIHGEIRILVKGHEQRVIADGNGPISAFVSGLNQLGMENFTLADYHEQAIGKGADAHAIAYVPLKFDTGETVFGVGIATNIDQAAVHAIVAGLNRKDLMRGKHLQSKDWWPFL